MLLGFSPHRDAWGLLGCRRSPWPLPVLAACTTSCSSESLPASGLAFLPSVPLLTLLARITFPKCKPDYVCLLLSLRGFLWLRDWVSRAWSVAPSILSQSRPTSPPPALPSQHSPGQALAGRNSHVLCPHSACLIAMPLGLHPAVGSSWKLSQTALAPPALCALIHRSHVTP